MQIAPNSSFHKEEVPRGPPYYSPWLSGGNNYDKWKTTDFLSLNKDPKGAPLVEVTNLLPKKHDFKTLPDLMQSFTSPDELPRLRRAKRIAKSPTARAEALAEKQILPQVEDKIVDSLMSALFLQCLKTSTKANQKAHE